MAIVTATVRISATFTQQAPATLPGTPSPEVLNEALNAVYSSSGTAADQLNAWSPQKLTFVASTPQALDLTTLLDPFQVACNFARINLIVGKFLGNTDGVTLSLGYTATTANAWTSLVSNPGQIFIKPSTANNDGFFVLSAPNATGWPVSATNKLLNLDPGANAFSLDLHFLGRNA